MVLLEQKRSFITLLLVGAPPNNEGDERFRFSMSAVNQISMIWFAHGNIEFTYQIVKLF